jgi:hypothetical protein
MNMKILSYTSISILMIISLIGQPVKASFTENTSAPTGNNTSLPLNTSATTQIKAGALISNTYMQADVFYDRYNAGYYLQPRGTNRVNYVVADNQLTYGNSITHGEVQASIFRDRNDGNFYVDPNGITMLNQLRADIIYDRSNTGYYISPRGTSRMNYVVFDNTYTYGTGNYADIYLRSIGRWASSLGTGGFQYRMVSVPEGASINQCPGGFYAVSASMPTCQGRYSGCFVHVLCERPI